LWTFILIHLGKKTSTASVPICEGRAHLGFGGSDSGGRSWHSGLHVVFGTGSHSQRLNAMGARV
jgi:hypothetical protein